MPIFIIPLLHKISKHISSKPLKDKGLIRDAALAGLAALLIEILKVIFGLA
nr:hypothetical protein [uncultured bacterium]